MGRHESSEFRKGLALNTVESPPGLPYNSTFNYIFNKSCDIKKDENIQKYIKHFLVAIIFEFNNQFENYDTDIHGRLKSDYSITSNCYNSEKYRKQYIKGNNLKEELSKDILAFKIIARNNQQLDYSKFKNDEDINELSEKAKLDENFKCKMTEFNDKTQKSSETISIDEYCDNYAKILEKIRTLIPKDAKKLKEHYDSIESNFNSAKENATSLETLIKNESIPSFNDLLTDFSTRIYSELNLKILTKEAESIFKESQIMERLGIKFISSKTRTRSNGYTANYIILNTPIGLVECQIQSARDYYEGNIGYAAHNSNMEGKNAIKFLEIPENKDDIEGIKKFNNSAEKISPNYFSVRNLPSSQKKRAGINNNENIVSIAIDSLYNNYKKVISEVPEGSVAEIEVNQYIDALDKVLASPENTKRTIELYYESTLDKYLNEELPLFIESQSQENDERV